MTVNYIGLNVCILLQGPWVLDTNIKMYNHLCPFCFSTTIPVGYRWQKIMSTVTKILHQITSKYTIIQSDLQLLFVLESDMEKVQETSMDLTLWREKRSSWSMLSGRNVLTISPESSFLPPFSFFFSPPRAADSKPSAVSLHCALAEQWLK